MIENRTKVLLILLFIISIPSFATHIAGGSISYRCLGGNNYELSLTLVRDCNNGLNGTQFIQTEVIGAYSNTTNALLFSINANYDSSSYAVTNPTNAGCPNLCYEEVTYRDTISLPFIQGGYNFTYQRCCRTGSIINLQAVSTSGLSLKTTMSDSALANCNSSPILTSSLPKLIKVLQAMSVQHSAFDNDNDSVEILLSQPHNFILSGNNVLPIPPNLQSNTLVTYTFPLSASSPISTTTVNPFNYNPQNKTATGTPNRLGTYLIAYTLRDHKNGTTYGSVQIEYLVSVCNLITDIKTHDLNKENVTFYPNPVSDLLTIDTESKPKSISIFNTSGKLISQYFKLEKISVASLESGIYFVQLKFDSETKTIKILKQ